ncbi:MAG: UDP-4-amino-4,6-dideoxy-N-acetyl-beta-L-altrosamine transaminase [Candidatus Krumholzibacteriia bacterium]
MTRDLPYGRQTLGPEEEDLVREVLRSDWLTQGPRVPDFERDLAAVCGAPCAVAVNNGTSALYLACRAAGLQPGDLFLTTPVTFAATANAGLLCGAEPVFADVDPETGNLDIGAVAAALETHPRIKAILPVHLGGRICDLEALDELAGRHEAVVIEDACHALGGAWPARDGKVHPVGSCARSLMTCFSFHPVKTITTGEGGAITTCDPELDEKLRMLRTHGITRDPRLLHENHGPWYYEMHDLGINARLTDIQAAVGIVQLRRLETWRRRRRELVQRYDSGLAAVPEVAVQRRPRGEDLTCWHLMIIRAPRRDDLFAHLGAAGIRAQVHYLPLHLHPYYRERFGFAAGDFPGAEAYYAQALSLPLFPAMTDGDCDRVIEAVADFFRTGPRTP